MLVTTDNARYKEIADALREKQESENVFTPAEMAQAIRELKGGDDKEILENTLQVLKRDDITKVKERTFFGSILEEVNLPNCTELGENAFYNCNKLKKINLPKVTTVPAGAFYVSTSTDELEEVILTECESIGEEAFTKSATASVRTYKLYAPKLKTIEAEALRNHQITALSNFWESLETIKSGAIRGARFFNESGEEITRIEMTNLTSINSASYMFADMNVEEMIFPVFAATLIGNSFVNSSVKRADFHKLSKINAYAFAACETLEALILRTASVVTLANKNALTDTPIAAGTGFIYVPDELVDTYKAASNWSTYADQIKPLSELPAE